MEKIYDSVGNEIVENCILRWSHFTDYKNKKHYMYKLVGKMEGKRTFVTHLPVPEGTESKGFHLSSYINDGNVIEDAVVVSAPYERVKELKRNPKMRD